MMKIGLIKENKKPYDKRVPFSPNQVSTLVEHAQGYFDFVIEPSTHRCFSDTDYIDQGISVTSDVKDCNVLMGIKEVPLENLMADKTYFFFSHTTKKQSSNRSMLQHIIDNNITLIDYEGITDEDGNRLVAFGRWAGIVGAYNGLWTFGKKFDLYELKRAKDCIDMKELKEELKKVHLPSIKIIVTGAGKAGRGVSEILNFIGVKEVNPIDLINKSFEQPVFAVLNSEHYNKRKSDGTFNKIEFYDRPDLYESDFIKFAAIGDLFFAAAYWDPRAPKLFTAHELSEDNFNISVIADITCDIGGSIPSTIKSSTIEKPVYDVDRKNLNELPAFSSRQSISVMAIDNLPCEIPRDASRDFGNQLMKYVVPELMLDKSEILKRATIVKEGKLMPDYAYLIDFVKGEGK